ncbi:MAG TPA: carboxypeptidase-like regulatory domain-containing protein [Pyrinomonadaceae bacterium]|nr:carboxypeptidase-like regulatory domain-containing protein [Pyrinomonadaceae bacterium]
MILKKYLPIFFSIFIIYFVSNTSVLACSCSAKPTVLSQFEYSKDVFIAKIVAVEKDKTANPSLEGIAGAKAIVQKVYKGNLKVGEELFFEQGVICSWTYSDKSIGYEILVYDSYFEGNPKSGSVSYCGRNNTVQNAADDLLYLNNLEKNKGRSRISGTINYRQKSALENVETIKKSVEGNKIKITNAQTKKIYEVKTDKNGVYEIYDLPEGIYYFESEIAKGWKLSKYQSNRYSVDYPEWEKLEKSGKIKSFVESKKLEETLKSPKLLANYLFPNRHADFNFNFVIDNSIKGRIFAPNGEPIKDAEISLIPIGGKKAQYIFINDYSNEKGEFIIDEIPVGEYVLAVNEDNKVSFKTPFRRFYYPAVAETKNATIFSIKEGQQIEGIEIHIPKFEEIVTVKGRVLYSNGIPAANERVFFTSEASSNPNNIEAFAKTDSEGRFTLEIMKGLEGKIYGIITASDDASKNCPSLQKIVKEKIDDKKFVTLKTAETNFRAEKNTNEIELKYNFDGCQKTKE